MEINKERFIKIKKYSLILYSYVSCLMKVKFSPSQDPFSSNFDNTASIPSQIYETIFQKYFKNSLKHQHFAFRQNPDSHQQSMVI